MNTLSIENNLKSLDKVSVFIEKFGEEHKLNTKTVFELNLVLDELITNAINYGYTDEQKHIIDIVIEKDENLITLQVIDDGGEFDPLQKEEVKMDTALRDKSIGGLGIHFVKQKVDEILYERKGNKNILHLIKRLK